MRREAWQHAEAMQWPDRRHEEWIRTDIRTFQINKFGVPQPTSPDSNSDIHQLREGVDWAGSIETIDSYVINESTRRVTGSQGCRVRKLGTSCAATQPNCSTVPIHLL